MEETRWITVKVGEALHSKTKQQAEANEQTMAQFMEMVLNHYFNREDEKEMATVNKRTLAFQVSEEFFAEVQDYIKSHKMKLKDFGVEAMRRMMAAPAEGDATGEAAALTEQK